MGYFERDYKHLEVGEEVEVKELEELPEQWRRSRLAWLCKELPSHKAGTLVRILNGQKKWMRQDDSTYVVVHCTRIRENEAAFQVVIKMVIILMPLFYNPCWFHLWMNWNYEN